MRRLNISSVNKKCLEAMVKGGALDSFDEMHRAQYFTPSGNYDTFLELALKYGSNYAKQKDSNQASLFGESMDSMLDIPKPPEIEPWSNIYELEQEKEITGIYLSGHPLDDFSMEYKHYITCPLSRAQGVMDTRIKLGGIVTNVHHGVNKRGIPFGRVTMQDYNGSFEFFIRNEDYENYKHLLTKGQVLYVEGMNSKGYNSDWINFKIFDIKLLDSVSEIMTKSITVNLDVCKLNDEVVGKIKEIIQNNGGGHHLKFKVLDSENQYLFLDLLSKNTNVDANFEFAKAIEGMGLTYSLN
jgi:DNA polymerase-3 subunit alpha